ncbi:MAG: exodeoxyribonuclease V subunit gamma [Pseudonocardia sp.]|nr:exodeoxyribonuclease V subunit gamma [Pseudonocardia sp.]
MLHLHRAERADTLAAALADLITEPPADPFTAEVVAVPARGMERWLAHRLAHRLGAAAGRGDGVCAHVAFPSPGEVVATAVEGATGMSADDDPWHPARAVWPLLEVVDSCTGRPWCAPLAAHLERARSRFAVVAHVTGLFDAYATHRPELLDAWRAGDDADVPADLRWQPALWRALRARIGVPDRAERLATAIAVLERDPACCALPERLSLFGPTRLPADHLAVLAALARHRDVHLWLPHPSPALWDRVAPTAVGVPARHADPTAELARHPLLAALGRDVRELQLRLAGHPAVDTHHPAVDGPPVTLLQRLHLDVRDDRAPAGDHVLAADDRSVAVHACHGPHRQVEVLREVVLGLLAADPTLEPRDVLVACPDVETFAPLVSAAFGLDPEGAGHPGHPGHRLAIRLADRALRQVNPVLDVAGRLLELVDARLTASEVLDLLATSPVRCRFGLDGEDLERLRDLVTRSGVRWGLSAAHRRPYRLDGFPQNTWSAGLDRLMLGVAMDGDSWLGTALPLDDVEASDIDRLGRLAEFVDRLGAALADLSGDRPLAAWITGLTAALDALTATTPADAWQAGQARAELAEVARTAGVHASVPAAIGVGSGSVTAAPAVLLGPADVRGVLAERLRGRPGRANFRTGTLTVATMVPMRSVPHRVICLLGLDDGTFPRAGVDDGDDVLARAPRVGERDPRSEDRQLLLDAVCAATEHLVVLYSGADPRTGARRPPAVPLGELLDAVAATAGPDAPARIVVRHPLQPFDARNFTAAALGVPGPFSFDRVELDGCRAAAAGQAPPPPFLSGPLPATPPTTVALDDLVTFAEHPVKQFLRQRVGLPIGEAGDAPADALPVALDALQRWAVGDRLLRDRLAGLDLARCRAAEWRRGELPPGELGNSLLAEVLDDVEELVAASARFVAGVPTAQDVDVSVAGPDLPDGARVVGTVGGVYGDTAVRVEFSKLAAKQRVRAWVRLVALTAAVPDRRWRVVTVGRGARGGVAVATVGPVPAARARGVLADLVALHRDGLREPLPLPTIAAQAYARTRTGGGTPDDALAEALRGWCEGRFPERDEAAYTRVFGPAAGREVLTTAGSSRSGHDAAAPHSVRGGRPAPDQGGGEPTRFGDLALRLWRPLLDAEVLG